MFYGIVRSITEFRDRRAIKDAEAELSADELAMFRQTRKAGPWRDAYSVILQDRAYEERGGPGRAHTEVEAQFDAQLYKADAGRPDNTGRFR